MAYWLLKSEPSVYPWDQLVKEKRTSWTGVRNAQAAINLKAMKAGDRCFFYHSGEGKDIVGIVEVIKTAYPDPTDKDGKAVTVDIKPVQPVKQPVTLAAIKADPKLGEELQDGQRYKAACAAALAASGKGLDAANLQPEETTYLLRLALIWLSADLASLTQRTRESPNNLTEVKQTLKHWKTDPDLAGVRDERKLTILNAGERESWAELWKRVDKVLQDVSKR